MKAINIRKPAYCMATTDGQSAEITRYGDIYEQRPTDWYGNPVEGQFVLMDEFLEDLKSIEGCKGHHHTHEQLWRRRRSIEHHSQPPA